MKKVAVVMIVAIMLFASTVGVFATQAEAVPYYVGTREVRVGLVISGNDATISAVLKPRGDTVFDKVNITINLYKSGELVYSGNWNTTYNSIYDNFGKNITEELEAKGTYYAKATFKCYKDGVLIETISKSSEAATY